MPAPRNGPLNCFHRIPPACACIDQHAAEAGASDARETLNDYPVNVKRAIVDFQRDRLALASLGMHWRCHEVFCTLGECHPALKSDAIPLSFRHRCGDHIFGYGVG